MKNKRGITLIALIITIIVMLILVGVTVNVALNGGLFSTAKRAASGMQMAQVRERAEVVKATLIAEAQSNNSIIVSKTEYKNRLLQEFEGSTAVGSKVIVEDGKYDIIIKNTDLDIEVVEHSDSTESSALIDLGYTTSNIEEDGKIYAINVSLNIQRTMNEEEYIALKKEQETEVATDETKKQEFLKYCYEYFGAEEPFTSIDEAMLYDINNWWGYGPFETLEEALQDETLQADLGIPGGTTREHLYYFLLNDLGYYPEVETESMTEQEVINYYYEEEKNNIYRGEFYKYTRNLSIYVEKDGTQELIIGNVTVGSRPRHINYCIGKNGRFDFIVKTSDGEEVAREAMQINNIATPNPYVLTKEEAQGVWETDGKGTITKYIGEDTEVFIPVLIGTEYITKIGDRVFYGLSNITSVKMTDEITSIGEHAFWRCTSLTNLRISNNLTEIKHGAFYECKKLTEFKFPNAVTTLGPLILWGCESIESIILPDNITIIPKNMFGNCFSLTNIIIPDTVTEIEDWAFSGCKSLTDIVIPDNVNKIGIYAFVNCESLKDIEIPEKVTILNEGIFQKCINLENVTILGDITTVGRKAFMGTNINSITLPNSVTSIYKGTNDSAFVGCTNLTTINFAPGSNPIPEGQPWGAPNENLTVTKLTQ